jgi:S1-C subfamily serine protease
MRKTLTVTGLTAVCAVVLGAGCTERFRVEDLTPEQRAAVADVRFYETLNLPQNAYTKLGTVEAVSCSNSGWEPRPSNAEALNKLRFKTAQMGGDGVTQLLCSASTANFQANCWRAITCAGTAIKIAKRGDGKINAGGSGSGFFINAQGDLVTNAHVTDGCSEVTVRSGDVSGEGDVFYQDRRTDLALVRTRRSAPAFLRVRIAPPLQLAEPVITVGFPLGSTLSQQIHITDGAISALAGVRDDTRMVQFTAPIHPGNSGGPLVDLAGNLVGVNTSGFDASFAQNVNFAVKTATLVTFLDVAKGEYRAVTSGASLAKTEVAANTARATVKLICDPSAAPSS